MSLDIGVSLGLAAFAGFFFGYSIADYTLKTQAIKRGVAFYHPKTGAFIWGAP